MPQRDKTGPLGQGPRTGLGLGSCYPGTFRIGRGRAFNRFCGCCPCHFMLTEKNEKEVLNNEIEILEEEIKAIKERLTEIDNEK